MTKFIEHDPVGYRTSEGELKLDERQYDDKLLSLDQTCKIFLWTSINIIYFLRVSSHQVPCKKTYCEKVADYPTEIIEVLNLDPFNAFFESPASSDRSDSRANRPGPTIYIDPREEFLCVGIQRKIWPKRAQLFNGNNWMHIINTEHKKQAITIEECG